MNKRKLTILCILLILAITCVSVLLTGCNDESKKQDAVITANEVQEFIYDGKVHNVKATLNHDETSLTYSPSQGYKDVGEYEITISSKSTKHYKSASKTVKMRILNDSVLNRWNVFLGDVTNTYSLASGDVKFNVGATATTTPKEGNGDSFKLSAVGNLDLTNQTNNNTNMHVTFGINDDEYGIYYQKGVTYLKINDDVFSLNNVSLDSLITGNITTPTANEGESSIVDSIIGALPLVLFSTKNSIANADGVWTLKLDVSSIWSKIKSIVLPIIGNDILSKDNISVIDSYIKENKIDLTLKLDLNKQNAATAEAELNVSTYGSFKANITSLEIANGAYENVEGALTDAQMSSAKAVNLANVKVEGTLNLVNTLGEAYEHLNWRLVVDIDPFALMEAINSSNGIDWLNNDQVKKMKVYFSLFHKHQAGEGVECTDAMCPTRVGGMEDTTLLDVAFDPQNFGNSKLYVAANLSRIFSESSFEATLRNAASMAVMLKDTLLPIINQNFMTSIDLTKTIAPSTDDDDDSSDDSSVDIKKLINPIFELLTKAIAIQDGAITLDMEQTYVALDKMFNIGSLINLSLDLSATTSIKITTESVKNAIFKGLLSPDGAGDGNKAFRSLSLGVDSIEYGVADSFDCKNAITHNPVDSSKARPFEGSKPLSLDDAKATATGNVISSSKKDTYYTKENGVHVTLEELDKEVVGKMIEYTYTAIDGNTYTAYTEILGYEGLDKSKIDTPQTIKAIVLPLDGKGGLFSDSLWNILHNGLIGSFVGNNLALPIKADAIDMQITLTEVESANITIDKEIEGAIELRPYELDGQTLDMSAYFGGSIALTYTDGYTRTISVGIESDLLDNKYLINDGKEHTIKYIHPSMPEFYEERTVQAVTPTQPTLVLNSDGGLTVFTFGETQGLKIVARVARTSSSTPRFLESDEYKITLNGKAPEDYDLSSDGPQRFDLANTLDDIVVSYKRATTKLSGATPHFYLEDAEGNELVHIKYTNGNFDRYIDGDSVLQSMTAAYLTDLGSKLDGKFIYYYFDTEDEWEDIKSVTLKFENGKYYMVDNLENPTIKVDATVVAYDKTDSTKTDILVNGLIPFEKLAELSYNKTNMSVQSSPKINIKVTFKLEGREEVSVEKTNIGVFQTAQISAESSVKSLVAGVTFDNMAKFVTYTSPSEAHEMRLTYKNGKYYFVDTFDGTKLDDIEIETTANIVNGFTLGEEVELTDGKLSADLIGKNVTITIQFTFEGRKYKNAVLARKSVVAATA